MPELMDGTSSFPSRPEMEHNLATFAERTGLQVRYDCRWEATRARRRAFVLDTSDGEYRCQAAVFAVGVAEPWMPDTPGFEHVAALRRHPRRRRLRRQAAVHRGQGELRASSWPPACSSGRSASCSPRRGRPSCRSTRTRCAGVRARYVQPVEDQILGGGVFILNASIDARRARARRLPRPSARAPRAGGELAVEADEVIAATGFGRPLRDLPEPRRRDVRRSRCRR